MTTPFFSVIIPAHTIEHLPACLAALAASTFSDHEILVVVDGGDPAVVALAEGAGVRAFARPPGGPAAARNHGAALATGQYLFFLDADCRVHPDTLPRAAAILRADPSLDAVIGAYDDNPAAPNFISQYKNLFHRYIHLTANPEATTFWSGCGALRRETFLALGGFDAERYRRPSIEDIELGLRLKANGGRIRLDPSVQVQHRKRWTLLSLLRSDIFDRALPWSRLISQSGHLPADLNLRLGHRLSALFVFAWPFTLLGRQPWPLLPPLLLLGLNHALYAYFWRLRGPRFALGAVFFHWLYYAYSAAIFAISRISR